MDLPFRFSSHSSTLIRSNGTHKPVNKNAARIPMAASMPKLRKAAISEKRFAEKAAMVVIDVSMMARPTRVSVMVPDSEALFPSLRSSLYRCRAWRESSIPRARTRIGRRFENCERAIMSHPKKPVRFEMCPMNPCIHNSAPPRATTTMATSLTRLKLT